MAKKKVSDRAKKKNEAPIPKGRLLIIGGHESKGEGEKNKEQERNEEFESEEILKFFVSKLSGSKPMVTIVPTASSIPEKMAKEYIKVLRELGVENIEVLDIRNREDAKDLKNLEVVEKTSGIFFTGGKQLRLTSILGGTDMLQRMRERYTYDDILIAGTSAGAVALSTPMIYEVMTHGGFIKGDVRITTGLEFMKDVAIDTHFIQRGRIVRMAQCIVTNPGCIGIGLEEDTAAYVTEGREVLVIGSGLMTVVDGMDLKSTDIYKIGTGDPFTVRGLKIHLLAKDETFTIPTYDQLHL